MVELVDVVIRTKNSEATIVSCLASIYLYLPVKNVVIVDGGSTDNTVHLIDESMLNRNGKIRFFNQPGLSLGEALWYGMEKTSTPFVACIDSDVFVHPDWFTELYKRFEADTGVVEGGTIEHYTKSYPFNGEMRRGFLINCLVRRNAILYVKPEKLDVREDAYLRYMMEKYTTFKWVKSGVAAADHHSDPVRYRDTASFLGIHRFHLPRNVIYQVAYSDKIIHDYKRVLRQMVSCVHQPVLLFFDMARELLFYLWGWVRR